MVRRGKGRKAPSGGQPMGQAGRASNPADTHTAGRSRKTPGIASTTRSGRGYTEERRRVSSGATGPARANRAAQGGKRRARQPRSAAIVLTLSPEAASKGESYAKILADARSVIKLPRYRPNGLGYRVAQTDARILEVLGSDRVGKADRLAEELRTALSGRGVTVSRPEKTVDIRLTGLDESVTSNEVEAAIREATRCPGQIKMDPIRPSSSGTGTMWIRCPVAAANSLVTAGRLLVGWMPAKVHMLEPRPLQCFRCLEKGHTRQRCAAEHNRSKLCYRCGQPDHQAAGCTARPECPVCKDQGRGAAHRCCGLSCKAPSRRGIRTEFLAHPAGGPSGEKPSTSRAVEESPSEGAMDIAE